MRPNSTEQRANAKVKQIRKTGFLKKQPPVVFYKKRCYLNFWENQLENTYVGRSLFSNKVAYLRSATLLTLSARRAAGSSTRGCRERSPPALYPRRQSLQETRLFKRKFNQLSVNVSFDSEFVLVFEIQPFKVAFFAFLKC